MVHIFEYEKKLFVGDFVPAKDLLIMDAMNFKVRMMSATDMHFDQTMRVTPGKEEEEEEAGCYRKNRPPQRKKKKI